jgi:glycerol kinase
MPKIDKNKIATGFIGLKSNTTKAQMFRSIIDSIAFSIKIKMNLILKDLKSNNISLRSIRISGGVSQSNFFCQYLSNLLEFSIERSETSSTSSTFGAAFLAGLGAGLFESINELENFRRNVEIFKPDKKTNYDQNIKDWETSLKRFTNWN